MPLRKPKSEQERRNELVERGDLAALAQHPAWSTLERVVMERQGEIERLVAVSLLRSSGPVDQQKIDYWRGYIKGIRWFASQPGNAEAKLEKHLREQGLTEEAAVGR